MKKIFIATLLAAATASSLPAANPPTINWVGETSTDIYNPSQFTNPANWQDGNVATGVVWAVLSNTLANPNGAHYVTIPDNWYVKRIVAKNNNAGKVLTYFIGDREMCIDDGRGEGAQETRPWYYADKIHGGEMGGYNCEFAGQVSADNKITFSAYKAGFRCDLAAWNDDPIVLNPAPTNMWCVGSGQPYLYGRRRTPELNGVWKAVENSPYLERVSGTAGLQLAPGSKMSGNGIPEGTYLRRIFNNDLIEMSAAATAGAEELPVTFAAFAAETHQTLQIFERWGAETPLWISKYTNDDVLVLDLKRLKKQGSGTSPNCVLRLDRDGGFEPGTLNLHKTTEFNNWLCINHGHVAFYATNNCDAGILKLAIRNNWKPDNNDKDMVGRISVPEADTVATIGSLIVHGLLTKDGPGTLVGTIVGKDEAMGHTFDDKNQITTYGPTVSNRCNKIVVNEGTLKLIVDADTVVSNMTVAAGARLAKCGEGKIAKLNLQDGAVILPEVGDDGYIVPIEVTDAVALAGGVVSFSAEDIAKLQNGTHVILTCDSLTVSGTWTLDIPDTPRKFALRIDGNSLKLSVSPAGTCVIIR